MSQPAASVVVCTRRRANLLERCLASLTALGHRSYEIVVVDNTSGDPQTERVAARAGARLVREPDAGLARARNTGASAAYGEVIAFIDDDGVAEPSWLNRHADALKEANVMASTGPVLPMALDSPAARAYAAAGVEDLGPAPFSVDRGTPWWFEAANFGGLGLGVNMAFRTEVFERGLRFRESLGLGTAIPGCEEFYAFFTILRRGHAVTYTPDAVVRHPHPTTMADLRRRRRRMLRAASAYLVLLLVEEPEFRGRTLNYVRNGMLGAPHPWRRARTEIRFVTRRQAFPAALSAPFLYGWTRLRGGGPR